MPDYTEDAAAKDAGWMSDVQRAIALILIGSFATICVMLSLWFIFRGDADSLLDMAKTLQAALVNMALIALGFFFGSNMSSKTKDDTISKIAMQPSAPIAPAPIAPASNGAAAATTTTTEPQKEP
jgi:hypothetical protein